MAARALASSSVIQDSDCPSGFDLPTSTPYSIGVNISSCSLSPFRNNYKKKKIAAYGSGSVSPTFTSACAMNATIDVASSSSGFAFPNYLLRNGSMHIKGSESLTRTDATPSEYLFSSMVTLPETCQSKSHFHISIILKGRNWSCCTAAMVDSGATALFIGEAFAKRHKMFLEPLVKPIKLLNIDGTLNKAGSIHYKMRLILCTRTKEKKFEFLVTDCGPETIVLGLPWLRIMNPDIDWAKGELHIWDCYDIALSIY